MTGGAARDAQAWPRGDWTPDQARGHTWEGLAEIVAPIHDGTHLIAVFRDGRLHINTDPDGRVTTTAAGRRYLGIEGGDPHVSSPTSGVLPLFRCRWAMFTASLRLLSSPRSPGHELADRSSFSLE